jgi:site-specific DNA recombinase
VKACFGYVRVSEAREEGLSPDIQRDAISAYALRHGWAVERYFEDLDLKGWQFEERPALQELLFLVRSGDCQAVIVYRLDRFTREPRHYYNMVYEIEAAGVELHDASEGRYDPGSDMQLLRGLRVLLAKNETATLSRRIKDACKRQAAMGRYHGGRVPFGYRHRSDGQPGLEADPLAAPWLLRIHDYYQRGWSMHRIARELNAQGAPTREGRGWNSSTIPGVLDSPYQVGAREHDGELVFGGNVPAIVPLEVWERTRALRAARTGNPARGRIGNWGIPSVLIRCANCGGTAVLRQGGRRAPAYHCRKRVDGRCDKGFSITAKELERIVTERLITHLAGAKAPESLAAVLGDVEPLRAETNAARAASARLVDAYAEGLMDAGEFKAARERQRVRLERAEDKLQRACAKVEKNAMRDTASAVWDDLGRLTPEHFALLSVEARREIFRLMVERVVVNRRGVIPRVRCYFRW